MCQMSNFSQSVKFSSEERFKCFISEVYCVIKDWAWKSSMCAPRMKTHLSTVHILLVLYSQGTENRIFIFLLLFQTSYKIAKLAERSFLFDVFPIENISIFIFYWSRSWRLLLGRLLPDRPFTQIYKHMYTHISCSCDSQKVYFFF